MANSNYRLIATQVGDLLKYDTSVNEIGRAAEAVFRFSKESFPNSSITSSRAQLIYDWVLSLARQELSADERDRLLIEFLRPIGGPGRRLALHQILREAGIRSAVVSRDDYDLFMSRRFHPEVVRNSQQLFIEGHYFHAVFEAAKAYNKSVREKGQSEKDGQALMLDVWGWKQGVLKLTPCATQTDKDVQDGVKFLSAGLMGAIRNPTAHEPALDWPISRTDCLDVLSFVSFLFRQLDMAVFVRA